MKPIVSKSPPWETFYNEVVALFDNDPDIDVMRQFSDNEKKINIFVRNDRKHMILQKYLPSKKTFGVVDVSIVLIPANTVRETTAQEDMKVLFADNKNVSRIETKGIPGGEVTYVAFGGAAQFFDDNMADINGNKTLLVENIARDVLNLPIDGVYFCTDTLTKPTEQVDIMKEMRDNIPF